MDVWANGMTRRLDRCNGQPFFKTQISQQLGSCRSDANDVFN